MARTKTDAGIAAGLVFAIFLWGGNNAGTKFIVVAWPPIWTGSSRFLCAGLLMLALFRWTRLLGESTALTRSLKKQLWWRGGLSLAVYIICFNWALRLTSASHVALYLGASPVWALLWEGRVKDRAVLLQRYAAALLALGGVFVLFWPSLKVPGSGWGEMLGLLVSVLWTNYGRQSRALGAHLSGAEVSAHTMWRAGVWLLPLALIEVARTALPWRADVLGVQLYCIIAGGVMAFGFWNHALRHWPASRVLLFNNLIPLSTMAWARFFLGEEITRTFWVAMGLIVGGVILGQTNWQKLLAPATLPPE